MKIILNKLKLIVKLLEEPKTKKIYFWKKLNLSENDWSTKKNWRKFYLKVYQFIMFCKKKSVRFLLGHPASFNLEVQNEWLSDFVYNYNLVILGCDSLSQQET